MTGKIIFRNTLSAVAIMFTAIFLERVLEFSLFGVDPMPGEGCWWVLGLTTVVLDYICAFLWI